MDLRNLDELVRRAQKKESRKLVVAAAQDEHVLEAVAKAYEAEIIEPVLVGNLNQIKKICNDLKISTINYTTIEESDPVKACELSVSLIKEGKADILMKGMVATALFLKAILNKENGLRKRKVLSHVALFEVPAYHKLIGITDAAMNIQPDIHEKINIIDNAVEVFHRLGQPRPKVAVLGPVEVVNEKIESTQHAATLKSMNERNEIQGCIIDGPLALDIAVAKEAAEHKNIPGEVAGDADILVTPDLNSGNILYKSLIFLGGSTSAAVVMGASAPIVLTSRADSEKSKFMSIVLAAALE